MIGIGIGIDHPVLDGSGGTPPPQVPILLIVAGQSNSGKEGTEGQTPPAKYQSLGIKIWNNAGAFVDYVPGSNPGDYATSWGTEAEFTYLMRQAGGTRPVYMVKRSVSATPVNAEAGDDWHPSSGELFDDLEARVIAARAEVQVLEGQAPEEITLWNQGERDMRTDVRATAFAANMTTFMNEYRTQISAGLFILERTRPWAPDYANGRTWTVRKGQLDVVVGDGNAAAVDCDFANPDDFAELHPGPEWCEGIGTRSYAVWTGTYAATYGDILDAVPDAPTFPDLTDQPTGVTVQSGIATPQGFERDCAVTVTGGDYRILNPDDSVAVDWTSAPGRIHKWQKIQLRQTSSASTETATSVTLDLGGAVSTWTVTTAAAPAGVASLFASGEEGAWYDVSDLSTLYTDAGMTNVTADGQEVVQWNDKSGNGYNVTFPAGDRPTYQTDGTRHWLQFDNLDDGGTVATRFGMGANPDITVVSAQRMLSGGFAAKYVWVLGDDTSTGLLRGSAGDNGYGHTYGNGNAYFNPVTLNEDRVISWVRDAGTGYGDARLYMDGAAQTLTSSTNPTSVPTSTTAEFVIGRQFGTQAANMRLYGMVVLDTATDPRRQVAEGWATGLV